MKSLIASALVALTLVTGMATTASADPQFGTRAWWDQQTNG